MRVVKVDRVSGVLRWVEGFFKGLLNGLGEED